MAWCCKTGSWPPSNDALHISAITVRYGSSTSMASFKMGVGIGSRVHDFVGEAMMIRRTLSAETFRNPWHSHQCLLEHWQLSVPEISESPQLRVLKELAHCSNLSPGELYIEDSDFHEIAGFHFSAWSTLHAQWACSFTRKYPWFCRTDSIHANLSSTSFVLRYLFSSRLQ